MMRKRQQGLGWFGSLIVLALAVGAGYYAYTEVFGDGEEVAPSCAAAHNACLKKCRRTTTEAPAAQICQQECRREADACAAATR
jgi:hypothetical protein